MPSGEDHLDAEIEAIFNELGILPPTKEELLDTSNETKPDRPREPYLFRPYTGDF